MNANNKGLFRTDDGRNLVVTFVLVSSLFLLWGVCNGMIDTMNKHFQTALGLSKSQSAWVQTAHYLGYFLMALPAGLVASKFGYKGGIITGLLMVSAGGFWFLVATHINALASAGTVSSTTAFIGYLVGVCAIAAGLTFLETVANPYTTVLGPKQYAATRINLAQSCNGVGFFLGPIIGGIFFFSKDTAGHSTADKTLFIPYVVVAIVVLVLAVVFYFAYIPDIKTADDYHLDDASPDVSHSIWSHPHFAMAVLAQFLYVAAQAGIFSFFINYMTSEVPPIPASWNSGLLRHLFETSPRGVLAVSNQGAADLESVGFICFLVGRFTGSGLVKKFSAHKVLGLYGILNIAACLLIYLRLGWVSVACVFLSFFFMSIMFPTIFALGIFGLGARAKKAAAYIVMAIMGGALLPIFMGFVADKYGMSSGFMVPLFCFAFVAYYGYSWPKLSKTNGKNAAEATAANAAATE